MEAEEGAGLTEREDLLIHSSVYKGEVNCTCMRGTVENNTPRAQKILEPIYL